MAAAARTCWRGRTLTRRRPRCWRSSEAQASTNTKQRRPAHCARTMDMIRQTHRAGRDRPAGQDHSGVRAGRHRDRQRQRRRRRPQARAGLRGRGDRASATAASTRSFIVRKISSGEGVERTFQTYSPLIAGSRSSAAATCAAPSCPGIVEATPGRASREARWRGDKARAAEQPPRINKEGLRRQRLRLGSPRLSTVDPAARRVRCAYAPTCSRALLVRVPGASRGSGSRSLGDREQRSVAAQAARYRIAARSVRSTSERGRDRARRTGDGGRCGPEVPGRWSLAARPRRAACSRSRPSKPGSTNAAARGPCDARIQSPPSGPRHLRGLSGPILGRRGAATGVRAIAVTCVTGGATQRGLLRQFLDQPLEERLAARNLVERDELVRLVRLLDRAGPQMIEGMPACWKRPPRPRRRPWGGVVAGQRLHSAVTLASSAVSRPGISALVKNSKPASGSTAFISGSSASRVVT